MTIPILYRAEAAFLVLKVSTEFHSGLQALFKISTDIVDSHEQQVRSGQGLGIRKLTSFHDMAIQMKYIGWINLALYLTLFLMEYRYILQRNR